MRSCSLDRKEHVVCRYGVFKVRSGAVAQEKTARGGRSLKTQQRFSVEVDIVLGDLVVRTINETKRSSYEPGATGVIAPESLERR